MAVLWWVIAIFCTAIGGAVHADTYTATAAFNGDSDTTFVADPQPSKVAAAAAAQLRCTEHARRASNPGHCELVRLDGKPLTTAAQIRRRVPDGRHPLFLWHYTTPTASAYLAGSVHVLKSGLYPLPAQFETAFAAADTLVLEVDLSQFTAETLQAKTLQYATLDGGQTLSDVVDAELYGKLDALAGTYGLPLSQLQPFKPAFVTQQLALLAFMSIGYDPNQGVESYFTQRLGERRVAELETIDFQLDLLMNQPIETQLAMVRDTVRHMPEFEALTADLIVAWMSGDDEAFRAAYEAQTGESPLVLDFMRQLLDERNAGMADSIAALLARRGSYFVLAGSAHFVGEHSIIERLEDLGLQGRRIYSDTVLAQP